MNIMILIVSGGLAVIAGGAGVVLLVLAMLSIAQGAPFPESIQTGIVALGLLMLAAVALLAEQWMMKAAVLWHEWRTMRGLVTALKSPEMKAEMDRATMDWALAKLSIRQSCDAPSTRKKFSQGDIDWNQTP